MKITSRKNHQRPLPKRENKKISIKERFEKKFIVTPGCWIWMGSLLNFKYGSFSINRVERRAHRVSYELYVGPIDDGLYVCHKCDNPRCVNPDHLFLGTANDNFLDMVAKGRNRIFCGHQGKFALRGEATPGAKLKEPQVLEIYSDSRSYRKIAEEYGISDVNVLRIKKKRIWKHLFKSEAEQVNDFLASLAK